MSRVVAVGAINVDLVVRVPTLPAPGETVVGGDLGRFGGGKGANGAVAAARLGAGVALVGAVGADDEGRRTLDDLRAAGVDVTGVAVRDDAATGAALIVVDDAGENQIAVAAGANAAVRAGDVAREVARRVPGAGCVLVSAEIPDDAVAAAVAAATGAGVPCVLNPAPARPALLPSAGAGVVLTPNAGEACALAGTDDVAEAAAAIAARTGADVVVTLGGDGTLLARPGRPPVGRPAHRATVVDTTGAGDAFNGALAARLAAGDALEDAVAYAARAAALAVGRPGAREGMPTAAEVAAA
ncbi:PfkB family carbohydrate kinase [Patulibacter sp. SYSU D01012]|uniref:PfkB family carbohydrate kinase n=1 Tax=Patulibacter sp. SYSU D01012 TaxID=2817381 RepID=UPI001B30E1A3